MTFLLFSQIEKLLRIFSEGISCDAVGLYNLMYSVYHGVNYSKCPEGLIR